MKRFGFEKNYNQFVIIPTIWVMFHCGDFPFYLCGMWLTHGFTIGIGVRKE